MAGIFLENVTKRYGAVKAVSDLSLDIADEEFLVLLGPSGCGKTTTMRMIAGLEDISEGEIYIGERLINDILPKNRDVAMVFQSYALYPHMTVFDNIAYPLKLRKVPVGARHEAVMETAVKVELEPFLHRYPKELSGGQRQRVALARALIRRPTVFLMDEPLSNLDAKLRLHMRAELKHLQHELKITTVYVTHDQIEAMTLASRIAVMNDGKLQQLATPKEIYNDPKNLFVAGFIGAPAMNFLKGDLVEGSFVSKHVKVPGLGGGSQEDVILGVRPEDLEIAPGGEGEITDKIYAFELTGESALVTLALDRNLITARADKDFTGQIGDRLSLSVDPRKSFLFDAKSEERLYV